MKKITGSIVALVTPFNADGSVDLGRLRELVDWHIENKTDAILTLGTTGETASTTLEEDIKTLETVVDQAAGRVPVIAGSGSNSSEMQKQKSILYTDIGAEALLCISPYYVKSNEEGMYRHFMMSAEADVAPIILYNVPGRTGCKISPEVVRRLSTHPNVMGIKEASGDMSYAMKVARYLSDDFVMYCGNDDITVPLLSVGACGVISVWANIMPRECHDMVFDWFEGRRDRAVAAQLRYLELINALFMEVNPIPVKEAMNLMGLKAGHYRMPMYPMAPENRAKLIRIMKDAGLKVQEEQA
ncbi:MAG: 4-hydroxy-tetrahydrodipicolinate synthase [Oscillospiraceae bacterium]|nr:4-hydroxy-tetrahydrodipicolinate synthase [Oscillospiraceae bacterium]